MNDKLVEYNNDIIIYTTDDGQVKIEVRLENERKCLAYTKCYGRTF